MGLLTLARADDIKLGTVIYGDSLIIDTDLAFGFPFNHSRGTYLMPSYNVEGFVTESKSDLASVHLTQEHGCKTIVYIDENIAILACLDSTLSIDLKQRKTLTSLSLHCLASVKFGLMVRMVCEKEKILFISDYDLSNHKFGKETALTAEFPFQEGLRLVDIGGDSSNTYFRWQIDDLKTTLYKDGVDSKILKISGSGKPEVIKVDSEAVLKIAKETDSTKLANMAFNYLKAAFILPIEKETYRYALLAFDDFHGYSGQANECLLFDGYLKEDGSLEGLRFINATTGRLGGVGWEILSAQIKSEGEGTKTKHTVQLRANSNVTANGEPAFGLFQIEFSFTEDHSKSITDKSRKDEAIFVDEKSLFDATFVKELEAGFYIARSSGKLSVLAHKSSPSNCQVALIAKEEGSTQYVYIQSSDMALENETLYALVDHSDNEDAVGSSLLRFSPNSPSILKIDTRHSSSRERKYTLPVKYILNHDNVTIDTLHFNLTDSPSKLVSHMSSEVKSKLAVHNANKAYFWPIPFDNEMISGPYSNIRLLSPKDALLYSRELLSYRLLDEKGVTINDGSAIVLEGHILKKAEESTYQIHNCYPFEANYMKTWCRDTHIKVAIEGEILAMRQTTQAIVAIHATPKAHYFSSITTFKGVTQKTELCPNASAPTLTSFGNSVYFAAICNQSTVQVWYKHLLTTDPPKVLATFVESSAPSIRCPQRLHVRKDKKTKLAIFDECPGDNSGNFYDIELDMTGQDFRHIRNQVHEKTEFNLTALCGHKADLVALINGALFLFKDDTQFLTVKVNITEIYSKIDSMTCLDHGRILITSDTDGLIMEIEKLYDQRYHPQRRMKKLPANSRVSHLFEDEDSVTINFVDLKGNRLGAGYYEFDSPVFFVNFGGPVTAGSNITILFSNGDEDEKDVVQIVYPLDVKDDFKERCIFKLKGEKILAKDGFRISLKDNPNIEFDCELWTFGLFFNKEGTQDGIKVNQAMRHLHTMETDVQTFTSYRGGVMFAKATADKTQIYVVTNGRAEVSLELKIGDYCVDSDMVHYGDEDWYAVFACFNNYKSYLVFASDQLGDLRIAEVDGYHTDPRVRVIGDHHIYLFTHLPHRDIVLGFYTADVGSSKKFAQVFSNDMIHDYEVFKLENTLFMIYSSNTDYAIRVMILHEDNGPVARPTNYKLPVDLPVVHSFRCHVNAKHATEVTCAFASDGYKIQVVTLENVNKVLTEKSKRSLKMYKNLSGLKMDFDEHILAISGNLFFYNPTEVSYEYKLMPGIAVYNLSDSSELIAGHISSKELEFNPTEHNHEIRIVKMHNVSMVGVRGHTGSVELYELRKPEVVFNKIDPEQFNLLRLSLASYRTEHFDLNKFFHLEGQGSTHHQTTVEPKPTETPKPKPDTKQSDTDMDVDTYIPDVEVPKHHKKSDSSLWYLLIGLLLFGGVAYYYCTKKAADPGSKAYEMTATKESNTQFGDNSMFDKTE